MTQATSAPTSVESCPRCHTRQSWEQSSWCPACGYYPSVDGQEFDETDDSWKANLPQEAEEQAGNEDLFSSLPTWFWVMMGGIATVVVLGLGIRFQTPEDVGGVRGLLALSVLGTALVTMLIAHGFATRYAVQHDHRVKVMDALVSWFTIWQPIIGALPGSRKLIWALTWGFTGAITAVLIIGGIDYNAPFRTEPVTKTKQIGSKAIGAVADASRAAAKEASLKESLEQVAESGTNMAQGDLAAAADGVADAEDAEDETKVPGELACVVYGVTTDSSNMPSGFLFAAKGDRGYQHVAEVSSEQLDAETLHRMASRLSTSVRKQPVIPSQRQAVWVNPIFICRLKYQHRTENGILEEPKFVAIEHESPARGPVAQQRPVQR